MSYPPQAPHQQYGPPPSYAPPPKQGAGLAIASMVLGIIALLLSWIPIINNVAAVIALVGLGLGIPALLRARRGTHSGTGMAITGLVTSVIAIVLVILTQLLFVEAIEEVEKSINEGIEQSELDPADPTAEAEEPVAAPEVVPLGAPAQVGDYEVIVDAVELDANATVAAANDFNEPPAGQYVITQLTVTYTGTDEGMPGWDLTAVFHGTDNRQYSDTECSAVLPDDAMDAPTLNPGGVDTFQFCMDVAPTAIPGGQLTIEPTVSFGSDERVAFAIQ
ncbi:UNVERIFIED_ORG: DUF4190 domain-containing protein [Bacillus sp. AZ43]